MAISFKVRFSKSSNQQSITIVRDDAVDLSAVTSVVAKAYTDDLGTADNSYSLTAGEVAELVAGTTTLSTSDVLGSATPSDDFYTIILEANSAAYVSDSAGVGITLEATNKALVKSNFISIVAPDYRVSDVLHTATILLRGMNAIELQEPTKQQRTDFTVRLDKLKDILRYD